MTIQTLAIQAEAMVKRGKQGAEEGLLPKGLSSLFKSLFHIIVNNTEYKSQTWRNH